jgi:hypothetical protein
MPSFNLEGTLIKMLIDAHLQESYIKAEIAKLYLVTPHTGEPHLIITQALC